MDKRTKGIVAVGVLVIVAMIAIIVGVVAKKAGSMTGGEDD